MIVLEDNMRKEKVLFVNVYKDPLSDLLVFILTIMITNI